jgi:hypothetical protein
MRMRDIAMTTKYNPRMIDVSFEAERKSTWKGVGSHTPIRGREYTYLIKDRNFDRLNDWKFVVKVPNSGTDIIVQPGVAPNKKIWAGIDRRSMVFVKATKKLHRNKVYCKANLADPSGEKNKRGTRRGQRKFLPKWFDYFRPYMRLKATVASTDGTDSRAQVVLVNPDDHERMIRLFFALKVWILQEGFLLVD